MEAVPGLDILTPCGKLSFDELDPDDYEDDMEETATAPTIPLHPVSTDLEDAAEEELDALDDDSHLLRKARALSQRLKYGKKKASTDRNRRVAGIARHSGSTLTGITEFDSVFGGLSLMISDIIATRRPIISLPRGERAAHVSFQFLKIIPATTHDLDPVANTHDWKSGGLIGQTLKVPGRMVQPMDPALSTAEIGNPHYLFESQSLRILAASLFEQLTPQSRILVPAITASKFFPYRERGGSMLRV
ncbi:hypothetical protein B0H14DRAFT_3614797 [Mycena olivaceomarginata]|nr:hypothetical protein B0H14DRAFT_3614797 [Mycena olivaceomarginata]